MANTEVIGSVAVTIGGDYSPLLASFKQAEGAAAASGQKVASSFTSGAAAAPQLVDQFGRALASVSSAQSQVAAGASKMGGALGGAAGAQKVLGTETTKTNEALSHQVTQMQAASAAIRVGFGEQSIRAVERLVSMIPGVGTALQAAFPVIAGLAFISMAKNAITEAIGLKEAMDKLAKATEEADSKFATMVKTLNGVYSKMIAFQAGPAKAKLFDAKQEQMDVEDLLRKAAYARVQAGQVTRDSKRPDQEAYKTIPFVGEMIEAKDQSLFKAKIAEAEGFEAEARQKSQQSLLMGYESKRDQIDITAKHEEAALSNQLARIKGTAAYQTEAAQQQIEASKLAAEAQIAGIQSVYGRTVATSELQVSTARATAAQLSQIQDTELEKTVSNVRSRAAAEAAGKTADERKDIYQKAETEIYELRAAGAIKLENLSRGITEAEARGVIALADLNRGVTAMLEEDTGRAFDGIDKDAETVNRKIQDITRESGGGLAKVLEIGGRSSGALEALNLEAQKLQKEREFSTLLFTTGRDRITLAQVLAGIDSKERDAKIRGLEAERDAVPDDILNVAATEKRAQLEAQIAELRKQAANADYQANTQINQMIEARTTRGIIRAGAASIQGAASRIPGAIGGALAQGVMDGKHIGQDVAQALKGIGKEMLGTVFTQLISVIALNTLGTLANTISTDANTFWLAVKGVLGFFGFADGGRPPVGVPSMVGERGPELFVPDGPGTIVPNHMLGGAGLGGLSVAPGDTNSNVSVSIGELHSHAHGIQSPRDHAEAMVREVPKVLKTKSRAFSPLVK
jgi:hypothetical protein